MSTVTTQLSVLRCTDICMRHMRLPNRVSSLSRMTMTSLASRHSGPPVCCAVVYVSEGRNTSLLDDLAKTADATASGAGLIRQFRDPTYNRTGFTIGGWPTRVAQAALEVSRRALQSIDLRVHDASHPRVGVVDHISIHPLGNTVAETATLEAGRTIAETLGNEGLPVLLYGGLKNDRRLAEVRRSTTYFVGGHLPDHVEADFGPSKVNAAQGISTIGCTPLITNYNILLDTKTKSIAAAVTRSVREKDGGLRWVEALTLEREDGRYETACNLLRPKEVTPAMVLDVAKAHAARLDIAILDEYATSPTEEEALVAISDMLQRQLVGSLR